ncbi:MAG: hypothetical protein E7288_04465 [Lachnospiraceae bacterium]|nr:hypothetical protein [Lachnospiraceae bacterium]
MKKKILVVCLIVFMTIVIAILVVKSLPYQGEYYFDEKTNALAVIHENGGTDVYKDDWGAFLYDYEGYLQYCETFGLTPRYNDETKKYLVYGNFAHSIIKTHRVKKIKIKEGKVYVYLKERVRTGIGDALSFYHDCYFLVIPVENNVTDYCVFVDTNSEKLSYNGNIQLY